VACSPNSFLPLAGFDRQSADIGAFGRRNQGGVSGGILGGKSFDRLDIAGIGNNHCKLA
jgi:hypothetical protein